MACRSPKVSGPAARPSCAASVVADQVGEPRRGGGGGASFRREARCRDRSRSRRALRGRPIASPRPSATASPSGAGTILRGPAQTARDPHQVQSGRRCATPGVSPTVPRRREARSADGATRSHLPAPFRPESRSEGHGGTDRLRLRSILWRRFSRAPIHWGRASEPLEASLLAAVLGGGRPGGGVAPADVPPTFANRYRPRESHREHADRRRRS